MRGSVQRRSRRSHATVAIAGIGPWGCASVNRFVVNRFGGQPESQAVTISADTIAIARRLVAGDRAVLASLDAEGGPYASLVLVAGDERGWPLLFLSDLAEHTKNIARDPRVSLLFDGTGDLAPPLAGPRLSLVGAVEPAPDPEALARYVARHPAAAAWAGLRDFHLYCMIPRRGHLVAGFGRIAWIDADALF